MDNEKGVKALIDTYSDVELLYICNEINTIYYNPKQMKSTGMYKLIQEELYAEDCKIADVAQLFNCVINKAKKRFDESFIRLFRLKVFYEELPERFFIVASDEEG